MSLDLDLVAETDADFNLEAPILGQFGRAGAAEGGISSLPSNSKKMMLTPVSHESQPRRAGKEVFQQLAGVSIGACARKNIVPGVGTLRSRAGMSESCSVSAR